MRPAPARLEGGRYVLVPAALGAPYRERVLMDVEIADDLRARAFAAIAKWIHRDQPGFDAVVGTDEEAAVLLPVVIGELDRA